MTYPHRRWRISGRHVIVTGEFVGYVDGHRVTGYTYRFEDSPASEHWITTGDPRIGVRNAQQAQEASPNDASSGPQSEVDTSGWDAA